MKLALDENDTCGLAKPFGSTASHGGSQWPPGGGRDIFAPTECFWPPPGGL